MATAFSIDRHNGNINVGEFTSLKPYQEKATVQRHVSGLLIGARDHDNGYEWLHLGGLTFGGQPASLSLCFHNQLLEEASWSVQLPGAATEGGWPTRDAINAELTFVRDTLAEGMGLRTGQTAWGEVWSTFDAKSFMAANGLRYSRV